MRIYSKLLFWAVFCMGSSIKERLSFVTNPPDACKAERAVRELGAGPGDEVYK